MADDLPDFLKRKKENASMTADTAKVLKALKKKREPAYVRRVTISIPLDPAKMKDGIGAAEDAFANLAKTFPSGTIIKTHNDNPLGFME